MNPSSLPFLINYKLRDSGDAVLTFFRLEFRRVAAESCLENSKTRKDDRRSGGTRWAPSPVINGVISPISRVITPVTHS